MRIRREVSVEMCRLEKELEGIDNMKKKINSVLNWEKDVNFIRMIVGYLFGVE